jgi:hypothetical protein
MNVPHLQLGISDAALMAASDERNGEVEGFFLARASFHSSSGSETGRAARSLGWV